MNPLFLIHIPITLALIWATWRTYKRGSKNDATALAACGSIVIINSAIKHFVFEGYTPSDAVIIIQQILSSLIIPFAYLFFAMQANTKLVNSCSITLFSLIALLLFPNINIVTATDPTALPLDAIMKTTVPATSQGGSISWLGSAALLKEMTACKTLNVITDTSILQYTIADLIIALQAVVTTIRVSPLYRKLKKYGMEISSDVKVFTAWWGLAAVFVVFSSAASDTNHTSDVINAICHIAFMVIMVAVFYLLGRGINFQPVLINEKNIDTTDTFAERSKIMAQQIVNMINEKRIHLMPGFSVDSAIDELNTNRTYFYRMLKEEFGCTFSELMNRERIKEIKHMLITTDRSISNISDLCGFNNTSYMIKVFKQLEGCTPAEWKRKNSIEQL